MSSSTITVYETDDGMITISWKDDPEASDDVVQTRAAICELAYLVLQGENLQEIN